MDYISVTDAMLAEGDPETNSASRDQIEGAWVHMFGGRKGYWSIHGLLTEEEFELVRDTWLEKYETPPSPVGQEREPALPSPTLSNL